MNKIIITLTLLGIAMIGAAIYISNVSNVKSHNDEFEQSITQLWEQWKSKYNKKYADPEVEEYRIQIFASHLAVIRADTTGTFGITKFSDLSQEEFEASYLNISQIPENIAEDIPVDTSLYYNWTQNGKVTSVKDQGFCGSCWAFATVALLESAILIENKGDLSLDLSEQQLVDCCTAPICENTHGCYGGNIKEALGYMTGFKITTEQNYPYFELDRNCNQSLIKDPLYQISRYGPVYYSTDALSQVISWTPMTVLVDAQYWNYYIRGVFSNCSQTIQNHAVLLVGIENGHWILKNSWGTSWGEYGYIRLANGNTCGVANSAESIFYVV